MKSKHFIWNYPGAQGTEFSFIKPIAAKKSCVENSTTILIVYYFLIRILSRGVIIVGDDFISNICKVGSAKFSTTSVDGVFNNIKSVSESLELCAPPLLLGMF